MSALPDTGASVSQDTSQASGGLGYLSRLPPEIRNMIFRQAFGPLIIYLRTYPPEVWTGPSTIRHALESKVLCLGLLQVNPRIRAEALEVFYQNCVLAIWGFNAYDPWFHLRWPAFPQVKNVAITFDRLFDAYPDKNFFPSLEVLFVDSINVPSCEFIRTFALASYLYRFNNLQSIPVYRSRFVPYFVICRLLHFKKLYGRQDIALKIFLRCTTWDEDIVLLVTEFGHLPRPWDHPFVPKFEYKFPNKLQEVTQQEQVEEEGAATTGGDL